MPNNESYESQNVATGQASMVPSAASSHFCDFHYYSNENDVSVHEWALLLYASTSRIAPFSAAFCLALLPRVD